MYVLILSDCYQEAGCQTQFNSHNYIKAGFYVNLKYLQLVSSLGTLTCYNYQRPETLTCSKRRTRSATRRCMLRASSIKSCSESRSGLTGRLPVVVEGMSLPKLGGGCVKAQMLVRLRFLDSLESPSTFTLTVMFL